MFSSMSLLNALIFFSSESLLNIKLISWIWALSGFFFHLLKLSADASMSMKIWDWSWWLWAKFDVFDSYSGYALIESGSIPDNAGGKAASWFYYQAISYYSRSTSSLISSGFDLLQVLLPWIYCPMNGTTIFGVQGCPSYSENSLCP